ETFQKISDPTVPECPDCGSGEVRKLISRSSFHLKGSGWYATDYQRAAAPKSSEPKSGESASSSAAVEPSGGTGPASASGGCAGGCACHSAKA
ncbi:MAG: zinc ribbon domain-containing protein, partial [Myxococcales bacterium]|nr:zinc ribbon domain-containing protein [Myxococcales bacterium]